LSLPIAFPNFSQVSPSSPPRKRGPGKQHVAGLDSRFRGNDE
jgi:hypothetical protein